VKNHGDTGFLGDSGLWALNLKTGKPVNVDHLRYIPSWSLSGVIKQIYKKTLKIKQ